MPADVLRVVAAASVLARWWYAGPASGAVMFPVTAVAAWLAWRVMEINAIAPVAGPGTRVGHHPAHAAARTSLMLVLRRRKIRALAVTTSTTAIVPPARVPSSTQGTGTPTILASGSPAMPLES